MEELIRQYLGITFPVEIVEAKDRFYVYGEKHKLIAVVSKVNLYLYETA